MTALRLGTGALLALLVLQVVWHAWLFPADNAHYWPALALAVLPLLPGLWTSLSNARRGVLLGGIVSLFYFCHGVSTLYSNPSARLPGFVEIALTLLVIGSSGWDARHYKRKR